MSHTDQDQPVSSGSAPHPPHGFDSPQKQSTGWAIFLFFIVGFVGSLVAGWVLFPELLYSEKHQPVDFNHVIHMDMVSEGCESCHYFREDGSFAGVPGLDSCIECHEFVQGEDPEEEKFVTQYVEKQREVPWLIYSKQPDCVFFSHAAHVHGANMSCESCHGDIGSSETLRPYEENRISGYSRDIWGHSMTRLGKPKHAAPMKMNDCAECHERETGSKGACFQCHK